LELGSLGAFQHGGCRSSAPRLEHFVTPVDPLEVVAKNKWIHWADRLYSIHTQFYDKLARICRQRMPAQGQQKHAKNSSHSYDYSGNALVLLTSAIIQGLKPVPRRNPGMRPT
jgi:hypothetical protein